MELTLRSRRFAEEEEAAEVEKSVRASARRLNLDLVKPPFAEGMFRAIVEESGRLARRERKLVAFQGEHGAYGEVAARRLVPDGVYVPCMEFTDVFRGVEDGYFDLGAVPVENSLEGTVTQVNELLAGTGLRVVGEANVPVHHCLLAAEDTHFRQIRVVYSHSQALAQCRGFLIRNRLEPRPYYDTAGAAKMVAREKPHNAAAIASALCAELYGLTVIEEGIEDNNANSTRFLLVSREALSTGGDKCSIVFSTKHEAGQLFAVLKLFAESRINLTRIASMPLRSDPGRYSFFLDFEGSDRDEKGARVLAQVKERAVTLNFLGCYPRDTGG
jgi:prephenate dehydratase